MKSGFDGTVANWNLVVCISGSRTAAPRKPKSSGEAVCMPRSPKSCVTVTLFTAVVEKILPVIAPASFVPVTLAPRVPKFKLAEAVVKSPRSSMLLTLN